MRSTPSIRISTIMLFAAPAIPIHPVAQEQQDNNHKHHHYKLIDMGRFGGPASNGIPSLNNRGIAIRGSATSVPAPPPATPLAPEASMGWPHSSSMASNGSHPWA